MVITNFQVQHVLKSYSRQLADGTKIPRTKVDRRTAQKDEVTISPESRKRLLADKIAREILVQFSRGSELSESAREILARLSREYGQQLHVVFTEDQGFRFTVRDEKDNGETKGLPAEENERLKRRLFDIAVETVYKDLM